MGRCIPKEELIFSDKQIAVLELLESPASKHITEVFYGGAAGGGKTFLIAHWQIERRIRFPGTRGFIGRDSLKNLKVTTLKTFNDVWDEYYRNNSYGITWTLNGQTNTIHFSNGSEIILMDLGHYPSDPEYHRLGSLELTDACIDELPEIKQKAFEILQSRIRYKLDLVGNSPKCLATGNPSMNWVKERYIKSTEGKEIVLKPHQAYIRATVHDNPNKDFKETYVAALEKLSPNDRLRLLEGEWDIVMNDNPWAWALSEPKHYTPALAEINTTYPLLLSWDFNHNPCVVVVGQYIQHIPQYNIIGCYRASSGSQSAIKQVCDIVQREFRHHASTKMITITGDASGTKRDPSRPSNINRYTDICTHLGINTAKVAIDKSNPPHKASRDLINDVLHQLPKGAFTFYGGRGCEVLLTEIQSAYPDEAESLNKAKNDLGLHGLDAFRYMVHYWFAHRLTRDQWRQYQQKINAVCSRYK